MAISTPVSKMSSFVEGKDTPVKGAPAKCVVRSLGDAEARFFKCLLYGKGGTGKTYSMIPLLEDGQKVLVISTDVGSDGLSSVVAEMTYKGTPELLKQVMNVNLPDYESVDTFLRNPTKIFPEIYEWNPDFLFWDGFSNFQQIFIQEEVEANEDVMRSYEAGSPLKYWGAVKKETQRTFHRFLGLHNKKTGKLFHKMVTCLEEDKLTEEQAKGASSEVEKMKMVKQGRGPMVQGAAAKLMGPGSDLVIRTRKKIEIDPNTKKKTVVFLYDTSGSDKVETKVRGLKLDPVMPADFGVIWEMAKKYYGLVQGAKSKDVVEEE